MLSLPDFAIIVGIALASASGVGLAALALLHLGRRTTLMTQLCIVVVATVLSVAVGMIAVAQAMYVSGHDLTVLFWVAGTAALVSIGMALVLGRAISRNTRQVRVMTRALGDGQRVDGAPGTGASAEFASIAAELAETGRRLAESRDEVATLDASRRELVAWISHDLRTPLAGLRAMAEALEDGLADDPQRFHRQMRTQVDHLSAMVDDLFELSMIHSGGLALTMQPVSLYDLVSDAVCELGALAESRSITLREASSRELTVVGDPRELARVIGNLLINAIHYSPAGSEISVTATHDGDDHVVLTVQDAGGGIPEQDLSKIFQAGWRASTARTPEQLEGRSPGAGLGLAIVQGIVEAHSGDISVSNTADGCRFDVRLPRYDVVAA